MYHEGAKWKAEGYVVEGVWFGGVGEGGAWDGDLYRWGHVCGQTILEVLRAFLRDDG